MSEPQGPQLAGLWLKQVPAASLELAVVGLSLGPVSRAWNSHPPCCHLRHVTHASAVSPAQASLAKVFSPPLIRPRPPEWGSPEKKGGETENLEKQVPRMTSTQRGRGW